MNIVGTLVVCFFFLALKLPAFTIPSLRTPSQDLPHGNLFPDAQLAPYIGPDIADVEGSYIIKFQSDHRFEDHVSAIGLDLPTIVESIRQLDTGYHGRIKNSSIVHEHIRRDPRVEYVEYDAVVPQRGELEPIRPAMFPDFVAQQPPVDSLKRRFLFRKKKPKTKAPWNLRLISMPQKKPAPRELPFGFGDYVYHKRIGKNVDVFVLDSGIYREHNDFEGRAHEYEPGIEKVNGRTYSKYCNHATLHDEGNRVLEDATGHGTHVAGIAGGKEWGVSKEANLFAVKISCGGHATSSGMISAIQDVTATHLAQLKVWKTYKDWKGSIINISNDRPSHSPSFQDALEKAVAAGVPIVLSAGNFDIDLSQTLRSECDIEGVLCVGAMTYFFKKMERSAWGTNVHFTAPGLHIVSAGIKDRDSKDVRSGTSMSSPHVSGQLSQILESIGPLSSKQDVVAAIKRLKSLSAPGMVDNYPPDEIPLLVNNGMNGPKR